MIDRDTYLSTLNCIVEEMVIQRNPDLITSLMVRKDNYYCDLFLNAMEEPVGVLVQDRVNNRSYRMTKEGHADILNNCNSQYSSATELEVDEDFMEKFSAIVAGQDYDTRIRIPIELPDDDLMRLMLMAHEKDITFNELVIQIIMDEVNKVYNEQRS